VACSIWWMAIVIGGADAVLAASIFHYANSRQTGQGRHERGRHRSQGVIYGTEARLRCVFGAGRSLSWPDIEVNTSESQR